MDAQRSNAKLLGLPQQLMPQAAHSVRWNALRFGSDNREMTWSRTVPKTPVLSQMLRTVLQALQAPLPKPFRPSNPHVFTLHTDSSDVGWGASLKEGGREVGACAQKWSQEWSQRHITHREAKASALGLHHLMHLIPPGSQVQLRSDAVSTVYAWMKGSKILGMNDAIARTYHRAAAKRLHVVPRHMPGQLNTRADWLSRNPDPKDFQLAPSIFQEVCNHFQFFPTVDLFATRHNRQVRRFCSWRVDLQSMGNAFSLDWGRHLGWCHPPWGLIPQALQKIQEDQSTTLVCLPMWETAPWWRTLLPMVRRTPLIFRPTRSIFLGPTGRPQPPNRWATLFAVVQGSTSGPSRL